MKAIIKEYLEETKNILKNKKIIITILLVTILSFGFTITHESVGPDDLCFDRYFKDTYILTQGRWVTFILYNVLHITSFSPFWMELLTTIVLFFTAITVCAFMKKQFKDEISVIVYLFSLVCLFHFRT